jgi:hypothetical protein
MNRFVVLVFVLNRVMYAIFQAGAEYGPEGKNEYLRIENEAR